MSDYFKNLTTVVNSVYKDNRFLDEVYKETLENLINEDDNYYKIYTLGEWGVLKNIIWNNWDIVDGILDSYDDRSYGLDFGFVHPTVLVEAGWKDDKIYFRQKIHQTGITNTEAIELADSMHISKTDPIYADPSRPEFIEEWFRAGYNIHKANNSVEEGIDYLKRQKFHITYDSPSLIKEVRGYKHKEDKNGNVMESPVKFKDDGPDGMRYGAYSHYMAMRFSSSPIISAINIGEADEYY